MARTVATLLMFDGVAEEAMNFYVSLFRGSEITRIERYGPGEQGAEGSIKRANFKLDAQELICFDRPVKHAFTFTPSISIFVDCENEAELDEGFKQLSADGKVLMPLGNYGFSAGAGVIIHILDAHDTQLAANSQALIRHAKAIRAIERLVEGEVSMRTGLGDPHLLRQA
jgi:predicted 3-demethylubiquinone-9 3-methyltransferase (glyoxalase superfamily)